MTAMIPILHCILEVGILFLAIYGVLYYLRDSRGSQALFGLVVLTGALLLLAKYLALNVISYILESISSSLVVVIFVLFQPELRRALAQFGSFFHRSGFRRRQREMIGEIVAAANDMACRKCGALIVIECKIQLQALIEDAVTLDNKVNSLLLESIFFPNAPLHDGAVIIRGDRIVAARAILPLTRSHDVSSQVGTRHRAALGISEESDAVTVVVSEETGGLSIAHRGVLHRDLDGDGLRRLLCTLLVDSDYEEFSETAKLLAEAPPESEAKSVDAEGDRP